MIDPSIPPLIDDLSARLYAAYGVNRPTLRAQLHAIGRDLPRSMQRQAKILAEAEDLMAHPKLSRQVNAQNVKKAHARLVPYLDSQDLDDKRKGKVISTALTVMVNLLILAVLIGVVLSVVDRG